MAKSVLLSACLCVFLVFFGLLSSVLLYFVPIMLLGLSCVTLKLF